jgi:diguanylate cyclase (GGDEF)-like protein
MFDDIYYVSQNYERDKYQIFSHLIEVVGGLTKASTKLNDFEQSQRFLAKVFAWFSALLTSVSVGEVEDIVWEKFPRVCPYCTSPRCRCGDFGTKPELQGAVVRDIALRNRARRPRDLFEWQQMFEDIYDQSGRRRGKEANGDAKDTLLMTYGRLVEELGEVSEAMRLQYFYPYNLRNEVADLFAWMCAVANVLPSAFDRGNEPLYLADVAWNEYPNACSSCRNAVCTCRPEPVREAISRAGVYSSEGRDELTGLWTRGKFDADFPRIARGPQGGALALLLIDCDNFKLMNDTTPGKHEQGDAVLREVASVIQDAVPPQALAYRRGGDEFLVVLQGSHVEAAEELVRSIEERVAALEVGDVTGADAVHKLSVSIGHAIGGVDFEENMGLHSAADQAMYQRKQARKL